MPWGLRFRRSRGLLPGIRLNASRSGLSVSLGGQGTTVTIGPKGIRRTIGVPGTGVYATSFEGWSTPNRPAPAAVAIQTDPDQLRQEQELDALTEELAAAEEALRAVALELGLFRARYLRRLSPLYAQLDRVEAEIAQLIAARGNGAAKTRAHEAAARARESARSAAEQEPDDERPRPSEDLRALYREAAKFVHPDLANDAPDRERRTLLMSRLNAAYVDGDAEAIREILRTGRASAGPRGGAVESLLRRVRDVRRRLNEVGAERRRLESDPIWELREKVHDAEHVGEDLLSEIEADLMAKIAEAEARLVAAKAASPT